MAEAEPSSSLEFTPAWVVAGVCFVIVLLSLCAERGLHKLGKYLKHQKQDALYEALQKLKEELMLLGFISLLLTVFQRSISRICIPPHVAAHMLPCKRETADHNAPAQYFLDQLTNNGRRLLSSETSDFCQLKGKVPLLSLEGLHHLHIFIFVLAVVHMIFCVATMVLGGARIRQWKRWEDPIQNESSGARHHHHEFLKEHADGYWRRTTIVGWTMAFFKQFYGSVTKSDYIALRQGFIKEHCTGNPHFDFHKYMMRTLEIDLERLLGSDQSNNPGDTSCYRNRKDDAYWIQCCCCLGTHLVTACILFSVSVSVTEKNISNILLLLVGAKLEHIISHLAQDVMQSGVHASEAATRVRPSDEHFWFNRPQIVLVLIHFIFKIHSRLLSSSGFGTYGIHSCIMEKLGYIIARLIMGVIVQVLCSYSTLPLYAIVTQMGSMFKEGMFNQMVQDAIDLWASDIRSRQDSGRSSSQGIRIMINNESSSTIDVAEQEMVATDGTITVRPCQVQPLLHPLSFVYEYLIFKLYLRYKHIVHSFRTKTNFR